MPEQKWLEDWARDANEYGWKVEMIPVTPVYYPPPSMSASTTPDTATTPPPTGESTSPVSSSSDDAGDPEKARDAEQRTPMRNSGSDVTRGDASMNATHVRRATTVTPPGVASSSHGRAMSVASPPARVANEVQNPSVGRAVYVANEIRAAGAGTTVEFFELQCARGVTAAECGTPDVRSCVFGAPTGMAARVLVGYECASSASESAAKRHVDDPRTYDVHMFNAKTGKQTAAIAGMNSAVCCDGPLIVAMQSVGDASVYHAKAPTRTVGRMSPESCLIARDSAALSAAICVRTCFARNTVVVTWANPKMRKFAHAFYYVPPECVQQMSSAAAAMAAAATAGASPLASVSSSRLQRRQQQQQQQTADAKQTHIKCILVHLTEPLELTKKSRVTPAVPSVIVGVTYCTTQSADHRTRVYHVWQCAPGTIRIMPLILNMSEPPAATPCTGEAATVVLAEEQHRRTGIESVTSKLRSSAAAAATGGSPLTLAPVGVKWVLASTPNDAWIVDCETGTVVVQRTAQIRTGTVRTACGRTSVVIMCDQDVDLYDAPTFAKVKLRNVTPYSLLPFCWEDDADESG